jgi:hypothetical protein
VFWITLRRWWSGWRDPLLYVQADTVTCWQRERFRRFWAHLCNSHRRRRGRPTTALPIRQLIARMLTANPLWRAPRIHGELKMLGIAISERTVSRILRRLPQPPSQTWKTFLHNHLSQMVSIDFFTVPTLTLKVLFVFTVLELGVARRCISTTSPSIPLQPGPRCRWRRPSKTGKQVAICCEIGTASTGTTFV